jgi:integrase
MPTVYKDGERWRVQVRRKGVQQVSKTYKKKSAANRVARRIEAEIDEGDYVAPLKITVRELFDRYRREVTEQRENWKWESTAIKRLCREKWTELAVTNCTDGLIDWCEERKSEVCGDTVNRELNVISPIFNHAMKVWRIRLKSNPVKACVRPPKGKSRRRRVKPHELDALWKFFGTATPTQVKDYVPWVFEFACETGLRTKELMRLRWSDVDFTHGTLYVLPSKNGDDRHAILTDRAAALLKGIPRLEDRVFALNAGSIGVAFRDACQALDIKDLHFHDSRHEACSQLAKRLSLQELAAVIGHRDYKSLQIYYNPTAEELAAKWRDAAAPKPLHPQQPTSVSDWVD